MNNNSTSDNLPDTFNSDSIFKKVWDASADGMRLTDSKGIMIYVNEAFCKMVGKNNSKLIGKALNIIYKKETQKKVFEQYLANHFTEKLEKRNEREIELWNGEIKDVELSNAFITIENNQRLVLSIFRDITESKKLEEELFESKEMLSLVLDNIPQRVFWKDTNLKYLGCNMHFADDAGLKDPDNILGMNDYELSWKNTAEVYRSDDREVMETGIYKINYEEPQTRTDGSYLCLRTSKVPLRDTEGKIIGVLGTYEDITDYKKAEEKLRMLSFAVEQSVSSIIITDINGIIEYVNPQFTKMSGYSSNELLGKDIRILNFYDANSDEFNVLLNAIDKGEEWHSIQENNKKNGEPYWADLIVSPIRNQKDEIVNFMLRILDITEKKVIDEQLLKAVEEKELMLTEIHHRVKNNLQIISSLLKIQSGYIKDPVVHEYFKMSQNRVKTMALIHEQLYRSSDLSSINFLNYINQLSVHLLQTYEIGSGKCKLLIDVEGIFLGIDLAIPCGLMINEILTNSLVHAFPQNMSGTISIQMFKDNKKYNLIISDNGVGIPENIIIKEAKSMGMQLLNTLIRQINGTIEICRGKGTEFRITFS